MKGTKRSMFLTTIAVVVLLVTAVATATYAWFTVSEAVGTGKTTLQAAKVSGANLGIGWTVADAQATDGTNTTIQFLAQTGTSDKIRPMIPVGEPLLNNAPATLTGANAFNSADISGTKFTNVTNPSPYVFKGAGANSDKEAFYIANNDPINSAEVFMTITVIEGGATDQLLVPSLRLAMFINDKLVTIYRFDGSSPNTVYGLIQNDDVVASTTLSPIALVSPLNTSVANSTLGGLDFAVSAYIKALYGSSMGASSYCKIAFVAWFDGKEMGNAQSEQSLELAFSFNGTVVSGS